MPADPIIPATGAPDPPGFTGFPIMSAGSSEHAATAITAAIHTLPAPTPLALVLI
jgi:hypothetical protein